MDPLYKGATRPPMLFGVPFVPLTVLVVAGSLLATWISIKILILIPVAYIIMRAITAHDDQAFRLYGLKMYHRLFKLNRNGQFWKTSTYSPIKFTKKRK